VVHFVISLIGCFTGIYSFRSQSYAALLCMTLFYFAVAFSLVLNYILLYSSYINAVFCWPILVLGRIAYFQKNGL